MVKRAIADGESRLGKEGRLVVRFSGTEPLVRVMAEGPNKSIIKNTVDNVVDAIELACENK